MNCKACDYPLWNITARQCPECGAPFKPSDYEFSLNSVRYCCPGCGQSYYGTGDKGHLIPRAFTCVTCSRALDMDEMILQPTHGIPESLTRTDEMPWLARRKIGRIKAWFATMGRAMGDPARLIALVPENHSAAEALRYGVITILIFATTGMSWVFIQGVVAGAFAKTGAGAVAAFAAAILATVALVFFIILAWTAITHLVLSATGPVSAPFPRTLHAICYSAGTNVLTGIPCFGAFMFPVWMIWWVISAGIMLYTIHRVRPWRAIVAIAAGPVVFAAIAIIIIVFAAWGKSGRSASIPLSGPGAGKVTLQQVGDAGVVSRLATALKDYTDSHDGKPPQHALALSINGPLLYDQYFKPNSENDILVRGRPIGEISNLSADRQKALLEALEAEVSDGRTAHRIGDIVFTFRGVDLSAPDSGLWVAILAEPDAPPTQTFWAAFADGRTEAIEQTDLLDKLANQNALRAAHNLPPLPDPRTITRFDK